MSFRRILFVSLLVIVLITIGIPQNASSPGSTIVAGKNVNMVSGMVWPWGDEWFERQNEPSMAVSSRNPEHILAGANDYRTVEMGGLPPGKVTGDAWLGLYWSTDGGQSWYSTLHPGYPQSGDASSPLYGMDAAADPTLRAGTNGLFFYSGIAFDRAENGDSVVFISRFIDNNNTEHTDPNAQFQVIPDPFSYIDTTIIESGTSGQFTDKPWIAADIPRGNGYTSVNGPMIPASNVYIVYSVFLGDSPANEHNKIMVVRSTDCGNTWKKPVKLSESHQKNQGTTLVIDPDSGHVYVFWRRFASINETDAILFCKSTNGGKTFTKPKVAWDITPFDQGTTEVSFRTSAFPAAAMDNSGRVYLTWADRGFKAGENTSTDARIVITVSSDGGSSWSYPEPIENPAGHCHQIMPTLTFAANRLMTAWLDTRRDFSGISSSSFINDIVTSQGVFRRTIDVRAARGFPGDPPVFEESIQLSRYLFHMETIPGNPPTFKFWQLQFNPPNYKLFKQRSVPFFGDYIDIVPSPRFLVENGVWRFNTEETDPSDFHVTWTDNRDAQPDCNDYVGKLNQNVYTSRITPGIEIGSPGNFKPLGFSERAFVVFVKNKFGAIQHFSLRIEILGGAQASFVQDDSPVTQIFVSIPPYSSISRSVFVQSDNPTDSVRVVAEEAERTEDPNTGEYIYTVKVSGFQTSVLLNPDESNPTDYLFFDEEHDLSIYSPNIENPNIENPNIENLNILNPNIENPNIANNTYLNPNIENPNIANYNYLNPNIANPNIENPNIANPNIANTALIGDMTDYAATDYQWTVRNEGTAISSYALQAVVRENLPPEVYATQLLIYRIHPTPTSQNCVRIEESQHELIVNIANPNIENPNIENPNIENPNIENPNIENSTFFLAPGEEAQVTLRVIKPKSMVSQDAFNDPIANSLAAAVTPHALNYDGGRAVSGTPVKFMTHPILPQGKEGVSYLSAQIIAFGGKAPYAWIFDPTALPPGLILTPVIRDGVITNTAVISGLPSAGGTFDFNISIKQSDGYTANQLFSIFIAESLKITTTSPLPDGTKFSPYNLTFTAAGGEIPYSWQVVESGLPGYTGLPSGLELTGAGTIQPLPNEIGPTQAGLFTFKVRVTDSGLPGNTADKDFELFINPLPLNILTTELPVGFLGTPYPMETIIVENAEPPATWVLDSGSSSLPDGLTLSLSGQISGTPIYDPNISYPDDYLITVMVIDRFTTDFPVRCASRFDKAELTITIDLKQPVWQSSSQAAGDDEPSAMVYDPVRNVLYAAGYTTEFDSLGDFYLVKYDEAGIVWKKHYAGSAGDEDKATAVAVDPNTGNVYLTGHSEGKTSGPDYWTLMVNSDGDVQWNSHYDGPSHLGDYPTDLALDSEGNVCVTGYSYRGNKELHSDYYTVMYDKNGDEVWAVRFDGRQNGDDEAWAIAVDETRGAVYVTGRSQESQSKDTLHFDYYTIKYDINTGKSLKDDRYNGPVNGDDGAVAVAIDPASGNVYVTGTRAGVNGSEICTIMYNDSLGQPVIVVEPDSEAAALVVNADRIYVTGRKISGTSFDIYTVAYDPVLAKVWDDTLNAGESDGATSLAVGSEGIYVAGFSTGIDGMADYFTIMYGPPTSEPSTQWQPMWIARYDGEAKTDDKAAAIIAVDSSGNVYVTGFSTRITTAKDITTIKY